MSQCYECKKNDQRIAARYVRGTYYYLCPKCINNPKYNFIYLKKSMREYGLSKKDIEDANLENIVNPKYHLLYDIQKLAAKKYGHNIEDTEIFLAKRTEEIKKKKEEKKPEKEKQAQYKKEYYMKIINDYLEQDRNTKMYIDIILQKSDLPYAKIIDVKDLTIPKDIDIFKYIKDINKLYEGTKTNKCFSNTFINNERFRELQLFLQLRNINIGIIKSNIIQAQAKKNIYLGYNNNILYDMIYKYISDGIGSVINTKAYYLSFRNLNNFDVDDITNIVDVKTFVNFIENKIFFYKHCYVRDSVSDNNFVLAYITKGGDISNVPISLLNKIAK